MTLLLLDYYNATLGTVPNKSICYQKHELRHSSKRRYFDVNTYRYYYSYRRQFGKCIACTKKKNTL